MTLAQEFLLTPAQTQIAFGALRAVIEADGTVGKRGAALLAVAADTLELPPDGHHVVPVARPAEISEAFPSAVARRALIDALVLAACIEGEVSVKGAATVRALATELKVQSPWAELLRALRRRHVFAIKRQLVRHSPDARRIFARTWSEEGLVGLWHVVLFVLGLYRNQELAKRFRELEHLPEGTVGRTFFMAMQTRKLTFPGERGGMPERMVHHDLMHVVNGYDTDPAGECELAGFYAGFAQGEAFTFLMIALTTFHLNLPVSPSVVTPAHLAFDPEKVLAAFLRGRRLRVDVIGPWDYWALMPLSLPEAQTVLGLREENP